MDSTPFQAVSMSEVASFGAASSPVPLAPVSIALLIVIIIICCPCFSAAALATFAGLAIVAFFVAMSVALYATAFIATGIVFDFLAFLVLIAFAIIRSRRYLIALVVSFALICVSHLAGIVAVFRLPAMAVFFVAELATIYDGITNTREKHAIIDDRATVTQPRRRPRAVNLAVATCCLPGCGMFWVGSFNPRFGKEVRRIGVTRLVLTGLLLVATLAALAVVALSSGVAGVVLAYPLILRLAACALTALMMESAVFYVSLLLSDGPQLAGSRPVPMPTPVQHYTPAPTVVVPTPTAPHLVVPLGGIATAMESPAAIQPRRDMYS
ncbi:hypothetical protein J8273_0114 [Carpediemonas membranifera]|uniref:Uncharacterized protein n=1 Tax=Carpediemonas membranifera TaxID=201153 RepID=A0A8J6B8H1_9EUKA|nr:hypothetical protein J8273_0114 [Carpediemonas membranifera]|eukprot:KAG9394907.1 hypothetical protein J8273_0114 [Carpediemonas membranifera]